MKALLRRSFATGGAVCVIGLSFQALATDVPPTFVPGKPTAEVVAELCQFPKVIDKVVEKGRISSPVELRIQPPQTGIFQPEHPAAAEIFKVSITVNGESFSFKDVSDDPNFPNPEYNPFYDILGTEAVVAESESNANVYCNVNSKEDSDFRPPSGGELVAVSVYWVIGPSGFKNQTDLATACTTLNNPDRVTDFFIAHHARNTPGSRRPVTMDQPVDFNGCNGHVPRFCNTQDARGEDFVVPCDFSGFGLITDSIIVGNSCSGGSGGGNIRC
jgi:hypothetical protein